jgi:hypothetical protein
MIQPGMRSVAVLVFVAGCGRIDFDPVLATDATADSLSPLACNAGDLDLVACYGFEGNSLDGSSYGNHVTINSATFAPGHTGTGVHADETVVMTAPKTPSLDLIDAFTFDVWVELDAVPPAGTRSMFLDNNKQYGFSMRENTLECSGPSNGRLIVTAQLELARWTHVSCMFDGAMLAIFIDGVSIDTKAAAGPNATNGTKGLRIGSNGPDANFPNPDPVVGTIDDVRIWRIAKPCAVLGGC